MALIQWCSGLLVFSIAIATPWIRLYVPIPRKLRLYISQNLQQPSGTSGEVEDLALVFLPRSLRVSCNVMQKYDD